MLRDYVELKYAVANLAALFWYAYAGLDKVLKSDDTNELVTSPISFVSTVNSPGLHCGLYP